MKFGIVLAAAGLLSTVGALPSAQFKEKDYYGECHYSLEGLLTAPYGQCLIKIPDQKEKEAYFCNEKSKCGDEGSPCHLHCVPSVYGGGDCVSKCAPSEQHPKEGDDFPGEGN